MKLIQSRLANGRFSHKTREGVRIGTAAFFSRIDKDGKPDYYTGHYVVTGLGVNGVVQCVPMTTTPTRAFPHCFNLSDPSWKLNNLRPLSKREVAQHAQALLRNRKGDGHAYDSVANEAADILNVATTLM